MKRQASKSQKGLYYYKLDNKLFMFRSTHSHKNTSPPPTYQRKANLNPNSKEPRTLLKSKSMVYRNRSLKQFFGDLPALEHYQSQRKPQGGVRQKQNAKREGRGAVGQKGRKQIIEDEYLIRRKEKGGRQEGLRSKYKKDNLAEANTPRVQTHSHFYDPSPYQWRKSKSKSKQQLQPDPQPPLNAPTISESQSEYYPTPKSSRNYNMQMEQRPAPPRPQARSTSSDSPGKRKLSHLKPRVCKHIFEGKGVKRGEQGERLLFTFGL